MFFGKYASRKSEAKYPSLWNSPQCLLCPSLQGPTGSRCYDLSGRNRQASLTNMDVGTDWVRLNSHWAIDTDGVNDLISSPVISGLSDDFVIAAWVNRASSALVGTIVQAYVPSYTNYWAFLGTLSGELYFALFDGTNNPQALSGVTLKNTWTHVAGRRNRSAGTIEVYVAGQRRASVTDTTTSVPAYSGIHIGSQNGVSRQTAMLWDDVFVGSGLSEKDVKTLSFRRGIAFEPRRATAFGSVVNRRRRLLVGA